MGGGGCPVASHNALVDRGRGAPTTATSPLRLILERPGPLASPPGPAAARVPRLDNPHRPHVAQLRGPWRRRTSVVASPLLLGLGGKLSGPDAPLEVQQRVFHLLEEERQGGGGRQGDG